MTARRLFHVSDVHFGREDKAAVAWFDRLVQAERPDAVVMTGDLTTRARAREFATGQAWLLSLGVPVTVEVGNHDLPYFNPIARLFFPYRRFRKVEHLVERPLNLPELIVAPLVTTARGQWRADWSKGHVSAAALERTLMLIRMAPPGALIFVACHHPLIEPHTRMHSRTHGGPEAFAALATAGVHAILTGHVHDPFDIAHAVDGHVVRLVGAGTLSQRTRASPPSFNEVRLTEGIFEVIRRTMGTDPDRVLPTQGPVSDEGTLA